MKKLSLFVLIHIKQKFPMIPALTQRKLFVRIKLDEIINSLYFFIGWDFFRHSG